MRFVLLIFLLWSGVARSEGWYGTAFAVGDGYTYITNEHVVRGAQSVCLRIDERISAKAVVINSDSSDDLAVLRANVYSPPLKLGSYRDIAKGMSVLTLGFPVPSIMGLEAKVTEGIVNSLTGLGGDTRRIQISVGIQPGNSGGPLLNDRGAVVGVVVSRLGRKFTEITGQVADSVGYAINVARLRALIETTPPLPRFMVDFQSRSALSRPALVSEIEPSVVLVSATDKKTKCEDVGDSDIPPFGAQPKTRAQVLSERAEADRIVRIRLQNEKEEEARRIAAIEAERKLEAERKIQREKSLSERKRAITEELDRLHPRWREIQAGPGFFYFSSKEISQSRYSLDDSKDPSDAKARFLNYVRTFDPEAAESIVLNYDFNSLLNGELRPIRGVTLVNNRLRYFVVDFSSMVRVPKLIVVGATDSKKWFRLHPERIEGRSSSFVMPPELSSMDITFPMFMVKE
jgi:hypothetical protein